MPFVADHATICSQCPHGLCIEDVRQRQIGKRKTKFRLTQVAATSCTFDGFVPGTDFDPDPSRTFNDYIQQFTSNIRGAGEFLFGEAFEVDPGAVSKVEGDVFELLLAAALWNAIAAWNRYMGGSAWDSGVFTAPADAIPTPMRRVAVVQLPRGYDSTRLFRPETRAALEAFEVALFRQNSELRLSSPDIVGVRLPDPLPAGFDVFMQPVLILGAAIQYQLAEAYRLLEGQLHGQSLLFAIAAKRSVRSDRLYQPLFEANVLKFLIGVVLGGSAFRFHVHVGSPEGADVEGHYRAASLVSLLRGGLPSRAVDKLYTAINPKTTAQVILDELPLFPL
jgi:hypothetical protein